MGIRWQIKFKSLLGIDYTLSIYDSSYSSSGAVTQLKGASVPFITNEDNNQDIYKPIRNQSGYIRFIAENTTVIGQMMPDDPTDRPVVLRDGNNNICWAGFLSNEQYSQPWEPCPYAVEIPVVSIIMAMKGVKFTQSEGYTSLLSLLNTINSYLPFTTSLVVPSEIPVGGLFVNNNNFREFMTIPERSERGTTNIYECQYIYDCVENFCQYFGISLHEYEGVFYFTTHNASTYYDVDLSGGSRESQWGAYTFANLVVCGANNQVDYSQAFRSVIGRFMTGRDKAEIIYNSADSFFQHFSVQGAYPTVAPTNLLFNGNSEVQPYINGIQQTSWMDETADYGGQIIRHREERLNAVERNGSSWNDYFFVLSKKSQAGTPSKAVVFNIPQKVYINDDEYAALNISCNVAAWYDVTQGGDFIKKLHLKIKVGNYWLKSEIPSGSPNYTQYSWTTTESTCWLVIDNGSVTMDNTIYTLDYRTEAQMEKITGFAIDMPGGLSAGYYDIYMELICNDESDDDFGVYSNIGYLIDNLALKVLRAVYSVTEPTPEFEENNISRFNEIMGEDYTVDSSISTKRGTQYGVGMALDANHAYIMTKYDEQGIIRRSSALGVVKEILTVDVRNHIQPTDYVQNNGNNYSILSQTINWRDDVNTLKIRRI